MNTYNLSRQWFDFAYEHPEKVSSNHTALYFFSIDHNNRLGWKTNFSFPTVMAMEAVGIKSYNTYRKCFDNLIEWGFIIMIKKSRNQYSSNVIALSNNDKANDKALDRAITKHYTRHCTKQLQSTVLSTVDINKPYNYRTLKQENLKTENRVLKVCENIEPIILEIDNILNFLKKDSGEDLTARFQKAKSKTIKPDDDCQLGGETNGSTGMHFQPPGFSSDYSESELAEFEKFQDVIDLLNELGDLQYSLDYPTKQLMIALVLEGYTTEAMMEVVTLKVKQTKTKMKGQRLFRRDWLAPGTLFKNSKFPKYANQVRDIRKGIDDHGVGANSTTDSLEAFAAHLQTVGL